MADVENPPVETTPLVGDEDSDEPPPLKDMQAHSIKEKLVGGAALVGLTTSVAAMAIESNPAVYVSGAIGSVVAPMAAMQQTKLTQVEALKQTNERISEEVGQLQKENVRLQTQVAAMEESVQHLENLSHTLESIRAIEGQSVEELEKELAESEKIFKKMKENLRGDILQSIITVAMAVDKDGDMCLSDDEINTLIKEIEKLVNDKVDFNDDLLRRKLIENGRSLTAIMDVIGDLMNDEIPKNESIFAFINTDEGKDEMANMYQVEK